MPKLNSERAKAEPARNGMVPLPTASSALSPYQAHIARWRDCDRCELATQRRKVVFARGVVPADILFAGEAPGTSENASGLPFDGPAGDLLDRIAREALDFDVRRPDGFFRCDGDQRPVPRMAWYNCVSCFPKEAKADGTHTPPLKAIRTCSAKMKEFVAICRPKLIVCVGAIAEKYIHLSVDAASESLLLVHIMHPANILSRLPMIQKDQEVRRSITRIRKAAEKLGLA